VTGNIPEWLTRLVRLLDDQFRVPGTKFRFGLDSLIGFVVPWAGDALAALAGCSLLFVAWRLGAPSTLLLRMVANIWLDALVGTLPLVGDLIDVSLKANRRNHDLLVDLLSQTDRGAPQGSTGRVSVPARRWGLFGYVTMGLVLTLALASVVLPLLLLVWVIQSF
jgi:Domain of unknown function (DUF4112)